MAKIETSTSGVGGGAVRAASSGAPERAFGMWSSALVGPALLDSLRKLSPAAQLKNPVMFVVYVGSILTTALWVIALRGAAEAPAGFILAISIWLWFTVLFANFAEALAEGRGKARADSLKAGSQGLSARRRTATGQFETVAASSLRRGDRVRVEVGELIPGDGEVIEGIAAVNEAAITGESAPVIRESGGDRSAVTGNTRVVSDWLLVKITANPGESTLDRMIALVEGAKRQKTPNEVALDILLIGLTLITGMTVMAGSLQKSIDKMASAAIEPEVLASIADGAWAGFAVEPPAADGRTVGFTRLLELWTGVHGELEPAALTLGS